MLRSKSKSNFKMVFSVDEIDKDQWNVIPSGNLYLDLDYLKVIEETVREVNQFVYVIYLDKNNTPIGKSIFQVLQFDPTTFNFETIPCSIQNNILRYFLNKKLSLLFAGNIFATGENIFEFKEGITAQVIFDNINSVITKLFKKDRTIKYAIFKEFYPNGNYQNILTANDHYIKFNIDVNLLFNMNNKWSDFNDVLLDYRTKYRSRLKNVLSCSKDIVVKEFDINDIKENAIIIEKLYQQVIRKSNFHIGVFNLETFYKLKEILKDKYGVFGYYVQEELIGFRTEFVNGHKLDASFIGMDYKLVEKYNLYQRILIDYINSALQHKVTLINFGRTAEVNKTAVGAEPTNMDLYIRSRRKTGKLFTRLVMSNIKPTNFSRRKPFKAKFYN